MISLFFQLKQIGGRLGYSIRGTLQSQAKAFVDFQHESRVSFLLSLLFCLFIYLELFST